MRASIWASCLVAAGLLVACGSDDTDNNAEGGSTSSGEGGSTGEGGSAAAGGDTGTGAGTATGGNQGTGAGGPSDECGDEQMFAAEAADLDDCMAAYCCTEKLDCLADDSCFGADNLPQGDFLACMKAVCPHESGFDAAICDSGLPNFPGDCGQCLGNSCCAESTACHGDAACEECFMAAYDGDDSTPLCEPGDNAAWDALATCRDTSCNTFCSEELGDTDLFFAASCSTCLEGATDCVTAVSDCYADTPGCLECLFPWPDDQAACDDNELYAPANTCIETSCADQNCLGGLCGTGLAYQDDNGDPLSACNYCLNNSCCAEISACTDDETCYACLTGSDDPSCADNALANAISDCRFNSCLVDCAGNAGVCNLGLTFDSDGTNPEGDECVSRNCCVTLAACVDDDTCFACETGENTNTEECGANQAYIDFNTCLTDGCSDVFGG